VINQSHGDTLPVFEMILEKRIVCAMPTWALRRDSTESVAAALPPFEAARGGRVSNATGTHHGVEA
jgi:hypothetical protein